MTPTPATLLPWRPWLQSGVWWVGRQPITAIQAQCAFALEEAWDKGRKFSAYPRVAT